MPALSYKLEKVSTLPTSKTPNTIYVVKGPSDTVAKLYMTDSNATNTTAIPVSVELGGTLGQNYVLVTDGNGRVITHSTITSTELGYLDGLTDSIPTLLLGKEPTIPAGSVGQYWRGDKTWQTLPTPDLSSYALTSNVALGLAIKEPLIAAGSSGQYWDGTKTWKSLPVTDLTPYITKASLLDANSKVLLSSLPDTILGQLEFMGTRDLTIPLPTADVTTKGNFYIASVAGTQNGITFAINDWAVCTGTAWVKVDNSGAVTSVAGLTGAIAASSLLSALGIKTVATSASYNDLTGTPNLTIYSKKTTVNNLGAIGGAITGTTDNGNLVLSSADMSITASQFTAGMGLCIYNDNAGAAINLFGSGLYVNGTTTAAPTKVTIPAKTMAGILAVRDGVLVVSGVGVVAG